MIPHAESQRLIAQLRGSRSERAAALRELFESNRASLYGLALRMTGHPDLADDAVQETFVDVLGGIDGFRGEARSSTWLFRIAIRAATRVAARAKPRAGTLPDELPNPRPGKDDDPSDLAARRETAARLLAALAALPAPERAVVALSALDDLPQTELATILGVPEGTVHSRLHRARERLRAALDAN